MLKRLQEPNQRQTEGRKYNQSQWGALDLGSQKAVAVGMKKGRMFWQFLQKT